MTETIDDKIVTTMKEEKDEFDAAFDEVEEGDPEFKEALHGDDKVLDNSDTTGTALKTEDPDKTQSTDGKTPDSATTSDGSQEGDKDADVTKQAKDDTTVDTSLFTGLKDDEAAESANQGSTATGTDAESQETIELKAALKAEQQKTSSWNGRIKKANDRADAAESKVTDLEERIKALESGAATIGKTDVTEDNEVVTKFFADFPEFEGPLKVLLANAKGSGVTMDEVMEAVKPEVEKVEKQVTEKSTQDTFMDALRKEHKDVDDLIATGEVMVWIEQQPYGLATELKRIYSDGGSLTESVNLLNEFKRTSGYTKPNQSTSDPTKDAKLKSMMEVDSDSQGPPAGQPDSQDFDAAADEAFKE